MNKDNNKGNDNPQKDINSQIDDILNEVRQQHAQSAQNTSKTEDSVNTAKNPQQHNPKSNTQQKQETAAQNEEEEFVDINAASFAAAHEQPQPDQPVMDKNEAKRTAKKEEKAAKKASKKAAKSKHSQSSAHNNTQVTGLQLESDDVDKNNCQTTDEADKILSELPLLVNSGKNAAAPSSAPIPVAAKPEKKKGKAGFVVAGIAGVIVLLGCSFFAAMALNPNTVPVAAPVPEVDSVTNDNEFVFAKGVSIAGTDIGGKTQKEARALVKIKENDFKEEFSVNVNYGNNKKLTYTQDDFSYSYNTDEVFDRAVQYSRDVNLAIQNGTIDELTIPEGYNVKTNDENGTVDFQVTCIINDSSIEKVVNRSSGKIDQKAREPHAEKYDPYANSFDKMFKWVEGSEGAVSDKEALKEDLSALFKDGAKSGDVTVKMTTEKPKHKMDEVKNNVQLIGKFSTVSTNGANANSNMATALAAIDGSIIEPGKNFSFNETTGDSNLPELGYLPASVIQNEQYVSGIGGGICQAATTIYNAMLLSGMKVEERANHFYTSVYVYGGLDATIDYPNLDLKMKNTTDYQIFVHTWMDGVTLNCEIYGFQPSDWDEIRTESECSWVGSESFGFEAQRVYYKNGKEVKREDLPDSTYSLKNGHYVVAGDPGDVSTKIKDPKKNLKIK